MTATARPPAAADERAVDATGGRAAGALFAGLSALRRRRAFHPDGVAATGVFDTTDYARDGQWGTDLLDQPARRRAVVRVSRGAGLPDRLPDLLGLAVRVTGAADDREQDLLLTSVAGAAPAARHVLAPARDYAGAFYCTLLPYRTATGRALLLGARAASGGPGALRDLDDVAAALAAGALRFEVYAATPFGAWAPVATVEAGERLPDPAADALAFDPFHTRADFVPSGLVNALRRRAYAGSQAGRRATGR